MDHNTDNLEFDLDDILKEFHEGTEEELNAILDLPSIEIPTITTALPQTEEPEQTEVLPAIAEDAAAAEAPLQEEAEPAATGETEEDASALPETVTGDTIRMEAEPSLPPELTEDPTTEIPAAAEPAFDVPEEFIPSPSLFTPKSRLRELKKQLVAGPEKRYYQLSEIGTGRLQLGLLLNLAVTLLCAAAAVMFTLDLIPENRLRLVIFSQILAMLVSALLGSHLMIDALADLLKGRFTIHVLLTITFVVCMLDGIFCLQEERIPCCAAFSLEMTMALWSRLQQRNTEMAQMDTMRKAVRLHGLVKSENYFEGKDGILRVEGEVADFMDTYSRPSSPEMAQSIYAALCLLACAGIAGFSAFLHGTSMGIQILSTSLLVAVPASFFVSITRPMAVLEARLHMVGTVLCGWEGVRDLCGKAALPLNDMDLFPQGSTKLNGVKFYGSRTPDEVVSYTASLICKAGGGLVPVFRQLLKSRDIREHPVDNFQNYGDGGIGGEVCGEPVLLGTLNFLQDMGVEIPEGTMVNQAVYAAIDGQLCAVYAISYAKMRSAAAGLLTLSAHRKLTLLKMPGDFMLTEDFLRAKFGVKTTRMHFVSRDTAAELRRHRPDANEPVLALVTRDDLISTAYAITGARALRQASRLGVGIHLIGGILGLLIMLVLGYLGSVELLTPTNILLYQLIWAVPGLLVTEWTKTV